MKDRIILGNKKDKLIKAIIPNSLSSFADFKDYVNANGLYADIEQNNSTTGDNVGVVEIGTAIDKVFGESSFFVECEHEKTATVHYLTNDDGGANLKFKATADFSEGDTFTVNGNAKTASLPSGEDLPEGFFVTDEIAVCFMDGSKLTFVGGGGGPKYTITSGTANPTGGNDGDIYFQYEV